MGTWMKGVKRHKLPGINSRDVNMCSIIKTTNTTACVTWESGQERKPEEFSFQGKKYIYFCFFHVVSIWDEGVFTKFTHSTMSVASQWNWKKNRIMSFLDTSKIKSVVTQRFGFPKETVIMDDQSCPCLTTSLAWPHRVSTCVGVQARGKHCSKQNATPTTKTHRVGRGSKGILASEDLQ